MQLNETWCSLKAISSYLVTIFVVGFPSIGNTAQIDLTPELNKENLIVQQYSKASVALTLYAANDTPDMSKTFCSGVIIVHQNKRYLLTASHCLDDPFDRIAVVQNYEKSRLNIVDQIVHRRILGILYSNPYLDIALTTLSEIDSNLDNNLGRYGIPFPPNLPPATQGKAFIIGYPGGRTKTMSYDCMYVRTMREQAKITNFCEAEPGFSGSPLVDSISGELVAIVSSIRRTGIIYDKAVDLSLVRNILLNALNRVSINESFQQDDFTFLIPGFGYELSGISYYHRQLDFNGNNENLAKQDLARMFRRLDHLIKLYGVVPELIIEEKIMKQGNGRPFVTTTNTGVWFNSISIRPRQGLNKDSFSYGDSFENDMIDRELLQSLRANGVLLKTE